MLWKKTPALLTLFFLAKTSCPAAPPPLTAQDVLNHLNQTIALYEHVEAADRSQTAPQNLLLEDNVRDSSRRAIQLAFAFARAEAAILEATGANTGQTATATNESRTLQQAEATANQRVQDFQARIDALSGQIARQRGRERATSISQRDTLAAYLDLAKDSQQAIQKMMSFASGPGLAIYGNSLNKGLIQQIDDLADSDSVPAALTGTQKSTPSQSPAADTFHPESAGIGSLLARKASLGRSQSQLNSLIAEADTLLSQVNTLKLPLRADLHTAINEGNTIASTAGTQSDPAKLIAARQQINGLAARFQNASTVMTPLGEEGIVLQGLRSGLVDWRNALAQQDTSILRYLAIRLGALTFAILLILVLSRIWHKGIFKYIREPLRRRQLMLVRRFVIGFGIALVLAVSFFTGLGSVATFAGFLTAGLALALQNVILSVVAYFFLIGRYGIRVGDRLSVSGVTGQVIEIGLVRFFMMELAGTGGDAHPTGRVAAWSNSMIFQPYSWLKQAPGVDYNWHLVTLTVSPDTNAEAARARVTAAVSAVYEQYRGSIEQQQAAFEESINMPLPAPVPVTRMHHNEAGCEIFVRYPVEFEQAEQIDGQILTQLRAELEKYPKLTVVNGGAPKLQPAIM